MHFELTEEQLAVKEAARDFAQNVLKPGVIERDNLQKFPAEEIKQLGELGFMGMMVSEKYNGSGMDTISYALAMEEISKVDASCSVVMSVNNSLVCWGLEKYGNEEQKEKYLGNINENDIWQAQAGNAVIIGFHVTTPSSTQHLADEQKVKIKQFKKTTRTDAPILSLSLYKDRHGLFTPYRLSLRF